MGVPGYSDGLEPKQPEQLRAYFDLSPLGNLQKSGFIPQMGDVSFIVPPRKSKFLSIVFRIYNAVQL